MKAQKSSSRKSSVQASPRSFTVIFEPDCDGGYNVSVPALPEICTFGETLEEAREMARDAIQLVIAGKIEEGEEIPEDFPSEPISERIAIQPQTM